MLSPPGHNIFRLARAQYFSLAKNRGRLSFLVSCRSLPTTLSLLCRIEPGCGTDCAQSVWRARVPSTTMSSAQLKVMLVGVVLAAVALLYLFYSLNHIFRVSGLPGDLQNRVLAARMLDDGRIPGGADPPWAMQFNRLLIVTDATQRVVVQKLLVVGATLIAIGYACFWTFKRLRKYGASWAVAGSAACAALSAHGVALRVGQFSPIVFGLACVALSALEKRRDVAAGSALAFAFVKPQMMIYAVLTYCEERRWKALVVFSAILVLATFKTSFELGEAPLSLLFGNLHNTGATAGGWETARFGLLDFAIRLGAPHSVVVLVSLLLGGIVAAVAAHTIGRSSTLASFAVMLAISVVFVYHRRYDLMTLWFLVIALFEAHRRSGGKVCAISAAVTVALLIAPIPDKIFWLIPVYYAQLIWFMVAAGVVVWVERARWGNVGADSARV
jgi:hypothetical protein